MRVLTTPLAPISGEPAPRPGGFSPALRSAVITPATRPELPNRLEQADRLVVSTGQQPGLFLGPLYTVSKALSAAALARRLEQQWQRPVVPIFWVAGDDHDFAEGNHVSWAAQDGSVATLTLRTRPAEAPLTPMYREPLGPEVEQALMRLEAELPGAEFKPDVLAWLRRYYRPAATMSAAYAEALAELLAPFGILCFDSTHPSVKQQAAPLLVRALEQAEALDHALAAQSKRLAEAGRDPGIPVGDGASLVMLEAGQGRDRLVVQDGGFATRRSRERFALDDLRRVAHDTPERLSPNVLLRPVVESALLPTVAYVAGPGELAYLALTPPLYQALEVHRQLPVPRWSGILVEPRVDRTLEKFGADLSELLAPGRKLEARVLRDQLPPDALETLEQLRAGITEGYARLDQVGAEIDPTLRKPIENARNHALSESRALEKRLLHHVKQRQQTEITQIARARTAVLPDGKPMERVFGVIGYLARYGPGVLDLIAESADAWYGTALEATAARA